ncbi:olfactory receptor 5V1-like [Pleurodeles waltl]|uniref:olfactory receptor 5V1-like n=1 Tax=Pleurodeles waltl TaxID=8319 RepID=UPI0037094C6A
MEKENQTSGNEFNITGFYDFPHLRLPLFCAFLLIYLSTLVGNLLIMAIVYSNKRLHTPMYFFVTNLAFLDITYTTLIFPKMLAQFFLPGALISLAGCLIQMYFFMAMVSTEFLLLGVMAYDRYVAICHPLRYVTIMNEVVCIRLAVGTWMAGMIDPVPHTVLLSGLSFCGSHTINHFFCDVAAVMKLSCSSTRAIEGMSYLIGIVIGMVPFVLTIISYINIISTILQIRSTKGRLKTFSTCGSHITAVILFYVGIISTYMRPTSTFSMKENKVASLSYVALTPLCNPIIYSLKNKEFKNTLRKSKNTT